MVSRSQKNTRTQKRRRPNLQLPLAFRGGRCHRVSPAALLILQLLITFISFPPRNPSWPLLALREVETVAPLEPGSPRSRGPYLLAPGNAFPSDPLRLVCKCASMLLIRVHSINALLNNYRRSRLRLLPERLVGCEVKTECRSRRSPGCETTPRSGWNELGRVTKQFRTGDELSRRAVLKKKKKGFNS